MTQRNGPDFDQRIAEWLEEDPNQAPRQALETVLAAVPSIYQRRGLGPPWRTPGMLKPLGAIAAAALILIVVGGAALYLLRPASQVGAPPGSPSPSPTACKSPTVVGFRLNDPACRYVSSVFRPTLSVAGAAGWKTAAESARVIEFDVLLPGAPSTSEGVQFVNLDRLAAKPCQTTSDMKDTTTVPFQPSSVGRGPADFFSWVSSKTPLQVATPKAVTIAGHQGLETTVTPPSGALGSCAGTVWLTWAVPLPGGSGGQLALAFTGWTWRIAAIDVNGATVIVQTWATPSRFAGVDSAAQEMLVGVQIQ